MQYRTMPGTGDSLSVLGFGCMRFPMQGLGINEKQTESLLKLALDRGVNYLDTAWPYHGGKSEAFLGSFLDKNQLHNEVKVATKLPCWLCKSQGDMDSYLDAQLKAIRTDHIDYYLLHSLDGNGWEHMKKLNVKEFLERVVKKGKIVNRGFSFHGRRENFKRICDEGDWSFCQIQYNLLDTGYQAGTEGLQYAASKGLGVIVMEPLRGGALAGRLPQSVQKLYQAESNGWSNAEWALRWVWDHPQVSLVLSGMSTATQVKENCTIAASALPGSMAQKEREILEKAGEEYLRLMAVGCTGCQYCLPCPVGVDIPRIFSFYNAHQMFKGKLIPRAMYLMQLGPREGRPSAMASQCTECGRCVKHCPQGIPIPTELRKIRRRFEGPMKHLIRFLAGLFIKSDRKPG